MTKFKEVELSIIIPVKDAYGYLKKCIESLLKIVEVNYEIICVNDSSTDSEVLELLNTLPQLQVLHTPTSSSLGFITSCNLGAQEAIGKYLLFLNSDTEITEPLSFRKMLDCFEEKKDIGVVGAKLLLQDEKVQHAGMSFDRGQMNFIHRYYNTDKDDPRVCLNEVVESVTGAVFMTSKELWDKIGGFDPIYGLGYFEDSDFCLKAKELGFKTFYCGEAVLRHFQSKSFSGGGPSKDNFNHNHEMFKHRWIRTGKVCEYPKVTASYIVFNEENFLEYSLKSIYNSVSKIIIVEGCTEVTKKYANEDGSSTDRTVEIIKDFSDPENKIRLIQGSWKDKTEQRNTYCKFLDDSDYLWVIDGDEVWDKETLVRIEHLMFARPDIPSFCFNFVDYWKDFSHISKGVWEQFVGRKSLINLNITGNIKYESHILPIAEDGKDIPAIFCSDIYFKHFSYCRPLEKVKQKIDYYISRGTPGYEIQEDWLEKVWLAWDKDPVRVEKEYGNHPFGRGHTELYTGGFPEVLHSHPLYEKYLKDSEVRLYITKTPIEKFPFKNVCMSNHDIVGLPMYKKGTIHTITVDDVLEHFSYRETANILISWFDKLKLGGILTVVTPNLGEAIRNYLEGKIDYATVVQWLYGGQVNDEDFHLISFDESSLKAVMEGVGFSRIRIEKSEDGMFLKVIGRKEKELV
jgi:GT2 family glycosyltransferase